MGFYSKASKFIKYVGDSKEQPKGVDFRGTFAVKEAGIPEPKDYKYQATGEYILKVLNKLDISEKDAILDIGCGKGKAMYLFSKYPFSQIDGYDVIPDLVETANKNIEALGISDRCKVECHDANDYDSYDDYNYFYMYNSVPLDIFETVLKRISLSQERKPRKLTFIYENSIHTKYIEENSRFREVFVSKSFMNFLVNKTPLKLFCLKRNSDSWFTITVFQAPEK